MRKLSSLAVALITTTALVACSGGGVQEAAQSGADGAQGQATEEITNDEGDVLLTGAAAQAYAKANRTKEDVAGSAIGMSLQEFDELKEKKQEKGQNEDAEESKEREDSQAFIPPGAERATTESGDNAGDSNAPAADGRNVIGSDDRTTVSDTYQYPYSAIAYMVVHARCGCTWSGTGFMVRPTILLTAAHCVVCDKHHKTADDIRFYFGYQPNGDYAYEYCDRFEYHYGTDFPGGYTDKNMKWDYAVVKLMHDVGNETGYFGVSVKSDSSFNKKTYTSAGYCDGILKYCSGLTTVRNNNLIDTTADTERGNSGGPIFKNDMASAINIAEDNDRTKNYGCRITNEVFDLIDEMDGVKRPSGSQDSKMVVKPNDTGKDGYILPQSSSHLYTRSELSSLDVWELCLARNEIPARHGYIFETPSILNYFKTKSWYRGTLTGDEFRKIEGILNATEEANVETILVMEREQDSPYAP
jgi:V8-like Glu-specific endopeptidase